MTASIKDLSDEELMDFLQSRNPNPSQDGMGEFQVPEKEPEKLGIGGLSDRKLLEALGVERETPKGLIPQLIENTPNIAKEGLRQIQRVQARSFEAAGVLGDTLEFAGDAAISVFEELFGYSPKMRQFIYGPPQNPDNPALGLEIPTSEDLKDITKAIAGDELEPRNEFEARVDEVIGDIGALLTPIPGMKALKGMSPARAIGTAVGANLAAEGLKQLDFGEQAQSTTKIGTMFVLGLLGRKGARQYAGELLQSAEDALPETLMVDAKNLVARNNVILKQMEKGLQLANKEAIKKQISVIEGKVLNGQINAKELTQINRDLNELIYELAGGPEELKRARRALLPLKESIHKSIAEVGAQNPEFFELWKDGNRAWSGVQASNRVSDFISRTGMNLEKLDPKTKAIVIASSGFSGKAALLASTQVAKGAEVMHQVMSDPVLRKFYLKMVGEGLKENVNGYTKNLRALDKEIKRVDELKRKERERALKSKRLNIA